MQELIKKFRELHPDHPEGGYFIISQNQITDWLCDLSDIQNIDPGTLAVSEVGEIFVAAGGDDFRGAGWWEPASHTE